MIFRRVGITFAVYGDPNAAERLIPFDIIPRILARAEWSGLEAGLVQRVNALNAFLADIYGKQEILKAGILPAELLGAADLAHGAIQQGRPAQELDRAAR